MKRVTKHIVLTAWLAAAVGGCGRAPDSQSGVATPAPTGGEPGEHGAASGGPSAPPFGSWLKVGWANHVAGMAASAGSLYMATSDGMLWKRGEALAADPGTLLGPAFTPPKPCVPIVTSHGILKCLPPPPTPKIVALAASPTTLYAATNTNLLLSMTFACMKSPPPSSPVASCWRGMGTANNVSGLAYVNNTLYAVSKGDNILWSRPATATASTWAQIGNADHNVRAMSADPATGYLYIATTDNYLFYKLPSETTWYYLLWANNTTGLALENHVLFGADTGNQLWATSTQGVSMILSTDWIPFDFVAGTVHVSVTTDVPSSVNLHVHQEQALPTTADWDVTMTPDPSGTLHSYWLTPSGPSYDLTASTASTGGFTMKMRLKDEWPAQMGATYQAASTGLDYPQNATKYWWSGGNVQGVAHDDRGNWLIANRYDITRIPVTWDLNNDSVAFPAARIPGYLFKGGTYAWNHIGDPDFSGGYLYAPIETNDDPKNWPVIAFWDRDLNFLSSVMIMDGATFEAPWVAVNPIDGYLYTSIFNISDAPGARLRRYEIQRNAAGAPSNLAYVGEVRLVDAAGNPMAINHIQGGAFSPMGHLYLVDDANTDAACPCGGQGIYGFDLGATNVSGFTYKSTDATWREYQFIAYNPGNHDSLGAQELEGIDFWNVDGMGAPGISGQLHVMLGETPFNGKDIWFKHYEASALNAIPWM